MDFVIQNGVLEKYKGAGGAVVIPDSVTKIKYKAFFGCSSLTSVTIPDSVTSIGNYAFQYCKLTSVTIPDSVTTIGLGAFENCSSLTSVTIPDSVTTIESRAFENCSSLTSIEVSENNTHYMSESGVLFSKDKTELIQYPVGNGRTEYIIPDSVTSIGEYAFCWCGSLTSVTIPDSVTTIGKEAFYDCESLTSVTIPDSVTTIGELAFSYCSSLTSVTIPDSVKTIGKEAFSGCKSLTYVTYRKLTFSLAEIKDVDSNEILKMVENRNFFVKMNHDVKYSVIWSIFKNTQEDEAINVYVKKNFSKMFPFLLDRDDAETVQKVLDSGKFLTKRNIDKFIQYAIDNKHVEIQVMLTNYKREKIGYSDPAKKLKL